MTLARDTEDPDAHLLRVCLDLQLDALLLTLGAAAQQDRDSVAEGWHAGGVVPWRRWVEEDVELAAALAADTLAGRATLPSTLGSDHDHRLPTTVVDNLTARYASMRDLLTDLLRREGGTDGAGGPVGPGGPGGPDDAPWRPRVRAALDRCTTRLAELAEYRLGTPGAGLRLDDLAALPGSGSPLARGHQYLPGELLG